MTMPFATLGLIAVAVGTSAIAQIAPTELETVKGAATVDRETQTEDVAFGNDRFERMTVPVRVSGQGPYRFLVDTGADRTAISRQVADGLKLKRGASLSLHSVSGVSTVATAMVPNLKLTRKDIDVANAPLLETKHMGADGILGTDALRSERVLFDFETGTMSIVPSASTAIAPEPGTIVVTGKVRRGRLIFTQAKANGAKVTAVLDTGSQISIGNAALRKALAGNAQLAGANLVTLESVTGGKLSGESMVIKRITIGGVELSNLVVVFADAHTFNRLGLSNKPSLLLGMNVMRAFKKVSIDFAQRKLRVVLPEESSLGVRMAALQ